MEFLYPTLNAAVILGSTGFLKGVVIAAIVWIISYVVYKTSGNTSIEIMLLLAGLSGYVVFDLMATSTPAKWQQAVISGILMYAWTLAQTFLIASSRENSSPHLLSGTIMLATAYLIGEQIESLPWVINLALAVILGTAFGFFRYKTRNGSNVMAGVFAPAIVAAIITINGLIAVNGGPHLTMAPASTACLVTAFLSLIEGRQAAPPSAPPNEEDD